ncbi:Aste57867_14836 [Aphanomyces stellatus]|uniref:Aste57867_14836 protein n=1 Tax=Aphanomyces stellatus TaxID=120398 RepID=A0A485L1Q7_9STRA|nr:hypothetical protein As57867_014780 [Aphanomyces stellatus]VFT91654.1 Aste57867_14836 [Aphanomyces stellatus]
MSAGLNPLTFINVPRLTRDERLDLIESAHQALSDLILNACLVGGPIQWTPSSSLPHGAKLYSGRESVTHDSIYSGVTYIQASLDEIAHRFHVELDDEDQASARAHARLLATDARDAAVLLVVDRDDTTPTHYVGIHWHSFYATSRFATPRDVCLLECHDEFELNGVRGFACVTTSIRLPWFPPLGKSHVRAMLARTGFVFLEMPHRPGYVQATHVVHADLNGNLPTFVSRKYMKQQAASVAFLPHLFGADRRRASIGRRSFVLAALAPTPKHGKATSCAACGVSFSFFTAKHTCGHCDAVMCRTCMPSTSRPCHLCYADRSRASLSVSSVGAWPRSQSTGSASRSCPRPRSDDDDDDDAGGWRHMPRKKVWGDDGTTAAASHRKLMPPKAKYEIQLVDMPKKSIIVQASTRLSLEASGPAASFHSSDDTTHTDDPGAPPDRMSLSCVYSFRLGSDAVTSLRSLRDARNVPLWVGGSDI